MDVGLPLGFNQRHAYSSRTRSECYWMRHALNNFSKDVAMNKTIGFLIRFYSAILVFSADPPPDGFPARMNASATRSDEGFGQSCKKKKKARKKKDREDKKNNPFRFVQNFAGINFRHQGSFSSIRISKGDRRFLRQDCYLPPGFVAAIMNRSVWNSMAAAIEFYQTITSALFELKVTRSRCRQQRLVFFT